MFSKIAHYEEAIYKTAKQRSGFAAGFASKEKLVKDVMNKDHQDSDSYKVKAMGGGAAKGALIGTATAASLLGGASLLTRKNQLGKLSGKTLQNMSQGALETFNPIAAKKSLNNLNQFNKSNLVSKGIQLASGQGDKLAKGYGTAVGVGAGLMGGGVGMYRAKSNYELARRLKEEKEALEQSVLDLEKTAAMPAFLTNFAAKSLGKKIAIGSVAGAGVGAVTAKPTLNPDGTKKSNRFSGAMSGAVIGGLLGTSFKKPKVPSAPPVPSVPPTATI